MTPNTLRKLRGTGNETTGSRQLATERVPPRGAEPSAGHGRHACVRQHTHAPHVHTVTYTLQAYTHRLTHRYTHTTNTHRLTHTGTHMLHTQVHMNTYRHSQMLTILHIGTRAHYTQHATYLYMHAHTFTQTCLLHGHSHRHTFTCCIGTHI